MQIKILRTEHAIRWCEFAVAGLITLLIVFLHVRFWHSAGPLWRDEVCSLHVSTAPSLKESWRLLAFENQPWFHYLVFRAWCRSPFGGTDLGLRVLGLIIGVILAGAIWLACWLVNKTPPLWALTLLGLNPSTFRADSLRPHGLGLVWIVLAFAFFWQLTFQERPKIATIVLAAIAALMSVQTVFLDAIPLGAICIASAAVLALRRNWRRIGLPIGIGLVAALSLVPYLPQIQQAQQWNGIRAATRSFGVISSLFVQILTFGDLFMVSLFGALALLGIASMVVPRIRKRLADAAINGRENFLFAAIAAALVTIGTFGFLWLLKFPLQDRYYLPILAVIALSITTIASVLRRSAGARVLGLIASIVLAVGTFRHAVNHTGLRLTNCDVAATAVTGSAQPDDFIVLSRFAFGITFERYYHGSVPWHSVPDISDYSLFRWDLVKNAMTQPDPMHESLVRAEIALRSGHSVFLVGHVPSSPSGHTSALAPAPSTPYGWSMEAYLTNWRQQLVELLTHHGTSAQSLPLPDKDNVDPVERLNVTVISGWRHAKGE